MSSLYPENDWRDFLEHSAKGQKWAKHKYIAIENGRYIYPSNSTSVNVVRSGGSTTRSGNGSLVKPKNLKAKPGGTSAVDEIKSVGISSAHGLHGHKRKTKFSKNSKSKTWTAETAVVKKRKKTNLRKSIGNILGRKFY